MTTKDRKRTRGASKSMGAARQLQPTQLIPAEWKSSLGLYDVLVAVSFDSREERKKALELFWSRGNQLYGVPREIIDGLTAALPAEAVPYLKAAGISFHTTPVSSAGELSAAERAELRQQQGHH